MKIFRLKISRYFLVLFLKILVHYLDLQKNFLSNLSYAPPILMKLKKMKFKKCGLTTEKFFQSMVFIKNFRNDLKFSKKLL